MSFLTEGQQLGEQAKHSWPGVQVLSQVYREQSFLEKGVACELLQHGLQMDVADGDCGKLSGAIYQAIWAGTHSLILCVCPTGAVKEVGGQQARSEGGVKVLWQGLASPIASHHCPFSGRQLRVLRAPASLVWLLPHRPCGSRAPLGLRGTAAQAISKALLSSCQLWLRACTSQQDQHVLPGGAEGDQDCGCGCGCGPRLVALVRTPCVHIKGSSHTEPHTALVPGHLPRAGGWPSLQHVPPEALMALAAACKSLRDTFFQLPEVS